MRYMFGDYTLDAEHYELHRAGTLVRLEPRVFNLLAYLVQHPGRTVTKAELRAQLWPTIRSPTVWRRPVKPLATAARPSGTSKRCMAGVIASLPLSKSGSRLRLT
jgi:hypothetical protein